MRYRVKSDCPGMVPADHYIVAESPRAAAEREARSYWTSARVDDDCTTGQGPSGPYTRFTGRGPRYTDCIAISVYGEAGN